MSEKATVAAGCFWGVEHLFRKEFGNGKGLLDARVGYCGGQTSSPSYRAVCSGTTGREYLFIWRRSILFRRYETNRWGITDAEALQVTFDPSVVTYRQLLEFFYRMHDPTTKDRQGPDMGTQYRSAIFTHSEDQTKIAHNITDKVGKEWYQKPITTQIIEAGQWWDAEDYHQLYLVKNPSGYECPAQYALPPSVGCWGGGIGVLMCYSFVRSFPPLSA